MPGHSPRVRMASSHHAWIGYGLLVVATPTLVSAAGADAHPRFGPILVSLAILVLAAKAGGLLAEWWRQPPVLGELLAGIALATLLPWVVAAEPLTFLRTDPTLRVLAEVGVLILLFDVGLEADLQALARVGTSSALVALIGVLVPMGLGWSAALWLLPESPMVVHLLVGATLTATSVGITARVLKDLGVMDRLEGQIILGAALLDDVLGLLVLALVTGIATAAAGGAALSGAALIGILLRALLFLGITVGLGHVLSTPIVRVAARTGHPEIMLVVGLALCFTLAFVAERIGLADIIGAFAAGLLLDPYGRGVQTREDEATLAELLHPLASLFVPLFFVVMGLQVDLGSLASLPAVGFGLVLILCAVAGKLACALGVREGGVSRLAVAIGMLPRGEVGLIFAGIGTTLTFAGQPLLSPSLFSAVVLMVLVTTLVAPVGLRWAVQRGAS
jgi:Kef-type K+ transport system membrane component KefB